MKLVITADILMQGHSRRLLVQVKPVQNSGTLPIICESIQHVSIGCVCARSKLQKGLDRYGYFLDVANLNILVLMTIVNGVFTKSICNIFPVLVIKKKTWHG